MCSTSEIDVFNSRDEIYLVFIEKKQILFLFYTKHGHFPIHKAGGENVKTKTFENTNSFGTTLILTSNLENEYPHFMISFINNGVIGV